MQPLRWLGVFFLAVFVGGALIAPWLYLLAQTAAQHVPSLTGLTQHPFHRYVNRAMLFVALIGLWPLLRKLRLSSWGVLGFNRSSEAGLWASRGFLLGFISFAIAALLPIFAGERALQLHHSAGDWIQFLFRAGIAAIAVAFLEELVFRGVLFGALKQSLPLLTALLVSSFIYALLHFFQRPSSPEFVHWTSGLVTLAQMFAGFFQWYKIIPGLLNLTAAGVVLALAYHRYGSLYFSIGLHAGWVFWLKAFSFLTVPGPDPSHAFWASPKLIQSWPVLLLLGVILLIMNRGKLLPLPHAETLSPKNP